MEQIAYIIGDIHIYWSAVVKLLAACAAICLFLALRMRQEKQTLAAAVCVPLAAALSLLLSRTAHWYFRPDFYDSVQTALNPFLPGEYMLAGAFAGCFLAAVILRLIKLTDNLPALLDCMCLAGGLGIALGRLASWFNSSDRGRIMGAEPGFPWVLPVINPVSGEAEYRLATFLIQAMVCGLILLGLLAFYLTGKRKDGDTALLFLLFYGASQAILDSTRYDALFFRSNGFIRVAQVLGAAAAALTAAVFAVRLVRAGGWKKWYWILWLFQASCFGLAGYMEYHVQRHGGEAVFAYSVMGISFAGIILSALGTRWLAAAEQQRHSAWLQQMKAEDTEGSGT